jgi:uncharacterized GH25 family protein
MNGKILVGLALTLLTTATTRAHDTWVQTNINVIRAGDAAQIDLMLGNHGNDHRDFKLAGKPDLAASTLAVLGPDGKRIDLRARMADVGYAPNEGFWTTRFVAPQPGLYMVAHTFDKVMSYAPVRAVKSAKTFFVASKSLDKVPANNPGFDRPLGHALELVPEANPVTPMGPGTAIKVRLLFKGKPLAKARVSFIPRGETLTEGFDRRYERETDEQGRATFTPTAGNSYLIVAHRQEPKESGKGHEGTKYSATLTVFVPQVCPCCGE